MHVLVIGCVELQHCRLLGKVHRKDLVPYISVLYLCSPEVVVVHDVARHMGDVAAILCSALFDEVSNCCFSS